MKSGAEKEMKVTGLFRAGSGIQGSRVLGLGFGVYGLLSKRKYLDVKGNSYNPITSITKIT